MLVLCTATQLVQPNALDNFSASDIEPGRTLSVRGKVWTPAGWDGEVVLRRMLVKGWHTAGINLWVTPYVNGNALTQLRTYISRPANAGNARLPFDVLVPCGIPSTAFPNVVKGLRATSLDALVEAVAPTARFDLDGVTFIVEPLAPVRARAVDE